MECKFPFEMVDGLGCLWLYWNKIQDFDVGLAECNRQGADAFEFTNFDEQQKKLFDFLLANGGISIE